MLLNTYEVDECGIIASYYWKICLPSVARRYRREENAVIS